MSSSILPDIQVGLIRYGMSITLVLSIVGNFFVVVLFARRRQNSCAIYLLASAVLNTSGLLILIPTSIYNIDHLDPTSYFLFFCKARFYFSHAWGQLARYMLVLACIDRFLLTANNARFRVIHRPKVARWIMGTVIVSYHIFIIHLPILTTINNGRCNQFGVYYILYQVHVLVFLSLIPPVSMAVFGYLAYRNMRQLHARIRLVERSTAGNPHNVTVHRQDRDLLIMVLVETTVYGATMSIYPFIVLEISITTYLGISKSNKHFQIESFIFTCASLLIYINSGIAFYLYCFISKTFRRDFIQLLTLLKHRFII